MIAKFYSVKRLDIFYPDTFSVSRKTSIENFCKNGDADWNYYKSIGFECVVVQAELNEIKEEDISSKRVTCRGWGNWRPIWIKYAINDNFTNIIRFTGNTEIWLSLSNVILVGKYSFQPTIIENHLQFDNTMLIQEV